MARFKVGDKAIMRGDGCTDADPGDIVTVEGIDGDKVTFRGPSGSICWCYAYGKQGDHRLELVTNGGTNVKSHRRTFKLLKDMPGYSKGDLFQEQCDDGTQPYSVFGYNNLDAKYELANRSLVEDNPSWFVEVFQVEPQFMTREELDQWEAFKAKPKKETKAAAKAHEPIAELKKRVVKSKHSYLREMKVGASTSKNASERSRVASAVSMYAKQSGKKFAITKSGANRIKITRVA